MSKKRPKKRLESRIKGGNWQGLPYLSYAEHDRCVRARMVGGYGAYLREAGSIHESRVY